VADKVFKDVEHLRLNGDEVGIPTQLAPIRIQGVILEEIQQLATIRWPGRVQSPVHGTMGQAKNQDVLEEKIRRP
jgi:hypothetical protein